MYSYNPNIGKPYQVFKPYLHKLYILRYCAKIAR